MTAASESLNYTVLLGTDIMTDTNNPKELFKKNSKNNNEMYLLGCCRLNK